MSKQTLMSLVDQAFELERALVESSGEITPEIELLIEAKEIHLPHKVDSYSMLMDRMDTVATYYKAKADMYLRMSKAATNVSDRCSYNLKAAMQAIGSDEITGVNMRFKLVNSNPACVVEDETLIDAGYKITEVVTKLDKKRIIEDLKLGVPVAGAKLERGQSLRSYPVSPIKKKVSNG